MRNDTDIAIVASATTPVVRHTGDTETTLLLHAITSALEPVGLTRADVDFTCAGSCDYISGATFSFVSNLDAIGAWPPKRDSHVEMDGAWALYEAWLRLHHGDIEIAVVTGSGRSSTADPSLIYPMEMDPYYLAPLGVDPVSFAALQARALIEAGKVTERQMAEVAARSRKDAVGNPSAQVTGDFDVDELLEEDYVRAPLRRHDLPPISDGACAVVLATAQRAEQLVERPAWITGLEHRSECHNPALRDLTDSPSTRLAAEAAGLRDGPVEVAELQAAFTHEEPLLREVLGLDDSVAVNPSGGALAANPIMATGLVRIAEAARQVAAGRQRTLAHATSGPCLQQNLVCILEGDS
ncbi:MAG TPA: lipid-transfer protein [Acidimicrobiia bacterium]|nr:lipid-transfer protein [Acidimicrobiia bacterium]